MKRVHVSDYDPAWPLWFSQIRDTLAPAVAGLALAIEHVGSTAVPGLPAKPVIDMDVVLPDRTNLPALIERLATLGYRHRGNLGIPGRDAYAALKLRLAQAHPSDMDAYIAGKTDFILAILQQCGIPSASLAAIAAANTPPSL